MSIVNLIPYIQIALSVLLIGGVLLQQSEAGLGGAFGGDSFSSGHHSKRGSEKVVFIMTIILAFLFIGTSFTLLVLN